MKISKTFTFDAGHRLSEYDGKCRSLHGHTYRLEITVEGETNKEGMVIDFGELKEIYLKTIDAKFDHKMILKRDDPINLHLSESLPANEDWIAWIDNNPTAENIILEISQVLKSKLKKKNIRLSRLVLWETPSSLAEMEF